MDNAPGSSPFHIFTDDSVWRDPLNRCVEFDSMYEPQSKSYASLKPMDAALDGTEPFRGWTFTYPENWTSSQVLDWLSYSLKNDSEAQEILDKFRNITGKEICEWSRKEFEHHLPRYGDLLKTELDLLLSTAGTFEEPIPDDSLDQVSNDIQPPLYWSPSYSSHAENSYSSSASGEMSYWPTMETSHLMGELSFMEDHQENVSLSYESYPTVFSDQSDCGSGCSSDDVDPTYQPSYFSSPQPYPISTTSDEDEPVIPKKTSRRGRIPGKSAKGNHLWEFVRDLLKNPAFNKVIKWEDRKTGVFRFVHSAEVANLWGRRKNNEKMTYEKLSRAMRFSRTAGYFADLPKDGKFPKKLCFKFGARSYGWQEGY